MRDIDTLLFWVSEREAIRVRKERGDKWPWTKDKVLQEWRFTNVRREDDAVTRWIARNIRRPYEGWALPLCLCVARMINWPPTLAELMKTEHAWPDDLPCTTYPRQCTDDCGCIHCPTPEEIARTMTRVLAARETRGEKVFTGAYKIPAINDRSVRGFGWPKVRQVSEMFIGDLLRDHANLRNDIYEDNDGDVSLEEAFKIISSYRGFGPFLAYQVVVDMRFTPLLDSAPDRDTWAAAGPGTIRGLNRLHGRTVSAALSQRQALIEMRKVNTLLRRELPAIAFDFSDVPNMLCEYDKYVRVKKGEGTPRTKYVTGQSNWPEVEPVAEAAE